MVEEQLADLPFGEQQWSELTLRALKDLGGDSQMVVGAKLRQTMSELGLADGLDVAAYVARSAASFSSLVESVTGVVVRRRPVGDVLIGTLGATEPESQSTHLAGRGALRPDVYQAFTRIVEVPFAYSPDMDRFLPEDKAEGRTIRVPEITVDTLIEDRHQFVESLDAEMQGPLLDSLRRSPSPLSAFRRAVDELGVLDRWGSAQTTAIWHRVEKWAAETGVTPRANWYRRGGTADSAHRALARIARYMTANEIRQLHIPFRAVEAFLSDQDRR